MLHLANSQEGEKVFDATLSLQKQELTPASLRKSLLRYPLMTAKVGAAIYFEAMRLWLKGTPFYPHPNLQTASVKND